MKIVKITNQRKYIWVSSKVHGIILSIQEDNTLNTLIPYQNVEINDVHIHDIDKTFNEDEIKSLKIPVVFEGLRRILNKPYIDIDKYGKIQYTEYKNIEHGDVDDVDDIDRQHTLLTGRLCLSSKTKWGKTTKGLHKYTFKPLNREYPKFIVASKITSNSDIYCKIEITKFDKHWIGMFVETIGDLNDESKYDLLLTNEFFTRDRNKNLRQFKKQFEYNNLEHNCENVIDEDWTDKMTISIDPIGCRDIDDALSLVNDEIAVHIATPTRFLSNTLLREQIQHQTTSLYGNSGTYNLIPDYIANDCASLVENEVRYCLSVIFPNEGETRIVRTKIINKHNYTYENCLETVVFKNLQNMYERIFGNFENDPHKLVENLMIQANVAVAKFLADTHHQNIILRKTINDVAFYLPYNELQMNEHAMIGDIYTHFTSPIRRYADQIIHENIFEILENDIEPYQYQCDFDTIVHLNLQKQLEKIFYNAIDMLAYFKDTKSNYINLKGNILNVEDFNVRVQLENDRCIYVNLVSEKIYENIEIEKKENKIYLTCDGKNIVIDINEDVELKLHFNRSDGLDGFKFEWIVPNIHEFLTNV